MFKKALLIITTVMLVLLAVCNCEEKEEKTILKLGHILDVTHPVHKGMAHMAELVEERSKGKMVIEIYPSAQLGNERTLIEQVKMGVLDMVKTSAAPMEGFEKTYSVFSLPYLFRDSEHYWTVLKGDVGKEMLKAAEDLGLRGLCYYDAGARSFYTKEKPILKPADLKGMKIRVMKSPVFMDTISAMGGSPTPIGWGELYTALQQGTVDGAENNPPSFYSSRHYEVCKHYSLEKHARVPDILYISTKTWDSLTREQQSILKKAAWESTEYQRELWVEATEEALEKIEKAGVKIYRPDKEPFADAVKGMMKKYEGTEIGALAERIKNTE